MWSKEQIKTFVTSKPFAIAAVSVGSFVSGAGGAYIWSSERLKRKYQLIADEEIAAAKHFYSKRAKDGAYSDPTDLAESLGLISEIVEPDEEEETELRSSSAMLRTAVNILDKQNYTSYSKPPSQEETEAVKQSIKKNVFDQRPDYDTDYDVAVEHEKRDREEPYIIPVAEYMSGDSDYTQVCLTYYEMDDTIANEADIPMEDYERTLGRDNLHFGRASGDPNIVYIRNEVLEEDYEVALSRKSLAEIAGFSPEDNPERRRFRDSD